MNQFLAQVNRSIRSFAKEEEGAQVVEYALIIAVVSIGLVLALAGPSPSLKDGFASFVTRVGACLTGAATGC
ncbi:Flp family type IVb pilin [Acidovorax sp. SRB_24]|uniref:Flp family type IVb pilin n=1 Tax=Acidovorax sp. SRB_24 TaxID=1962700 RepID=UPI00145EC0F7|nr:Flp family type IVb pilin [Acidovorax sp. SRB_24]NMM78541.1 hypothetical protein [Acidovorax sp. SRB_24]